MFPLKDTDHCASVVVTRSLDIICPGYNLKMYKLVTDERIFMLNFTCNFSSFGDFGRGAGDASKTSTLSYAELMQCVGDQNFQHSWDSALDNYRLAAHCVLPAPSNKESDKVAIL